MFDCVLNANLYMFCSSKQSNENWAPIKACLKTYTLTLFENNTAYWAQAINSGIGQYSFIDSNLLASAAGSIALTDKNKPP